MSKFLFFILAFISLLALRPEPAVSQSLFIKGSDTMLPLADNLAKLYMSRHKTFALKVEGGGSGTGIRGIQQGTVDIAMSSREMRASEKEGFSNLKEVVVAYDALSIIVHRMNGIQKLTVKEVSRVLAGEVRNWKELGGKDLPITVYTRDRKSGTYGYVRKYIMGNAEFAPNAVEKPSNASIVQSLMDDPGGIGYVGIAYVDEAVQTVSIASSKRGKYWAPTFRNALEKNYPLLRPLYYYYQGKNDRRVSLFKAFSLSQLGQQSASSSGYIPARNAQ